MAAEFPDRKEQLIFLINNYDMMLAVLSVGHLFPHPLTPSHSHPLILTLSFPYPLPPHPLTLYCNSLTPSHPHPLPLTPSPLTHSHPLIPFHPLTPYCNSLTPSGLSPPQPLTPSSLISLTSHTLSPTHGPHTLTPSHPHLLNPSPLTHFHLLMAHTPSHPQTLTLSPTHPSTLTTQLTHPLTSHSLPPSPPLQEQTSEESKESESFKSLLHARTQEFVQEVRVFIRTWYVHGMCVRACVRVCVHV